MGRLCHPAESGFGTQVLRRKAVDVRAVEHIETRVGTTGSTSAQIWGYCPSLSKCKGQQGLSSLMYYAAGDAYFEHLAKL